jgi:hypothetical protein
MTSVSGPILCLSCRHLQSSPYMAPWKCAAFTGEFGIPDEIRYGGRDHREPWPGDGGITYEVRRGLEALLQNYDDAQARLGGAAVDTALGMNGMEGASRAAPGDTAPGPTVTEQLASGPLRMFADWPDPVLPKGPPGIYTLWADTKLLYVGISYKDAKDTTNPQAAGVWGRLSVHAKARRTSDLMVALGDRFVIPNLTPSELETGCLRSPGTDEGLVPCPCGLPGSGRRRSDRPETRSGYPIAGAPRVRPADV